MYRARRSDNPIVAVTLLFVVVCAVRASGQASAPGSAEPAVNGPGAEPQPLMNVTLTCDPAWSMTVVPLASVGVDIVTLAGKTPGDVVEPAGLRVEYLPGAALCLYLAPRDGQDNTKQRIELFVSLSAAEHGKTICLRPDGSLVYKDDRICWIGFREGGGTSPPAKESDASQEARPLQQSNEEMFAKVKEAYDAGQLPNTCIAQVGSDASDLALLQQLKGSGIGLFVAETSHAVLPTVTSVKPTRLAIATEAFVEVSDHLDQVETLFLICDEKTPISSLSKLPAMRHLAVFVDGSKVKLDMYTIQDLQQLLSLNIIGESIEHPEVIGKLSQLQFLMNATETPIPTGDLCRLPRLQYLLSRFPDGTNMSFVKSMPSLQTLVAADFSEKLDLSPLKEARGLKCLAISLDTEESEKALGYRNITSLKRDRPDIQIVPYEGMCLGSWWLIPVVVLAAVAAYLVHRRRRLCW